MKNIPLRSGLEDLTAVFEEDEGFVEFKFSQKKVNMRFLAVSGWAIF